MNTAVIISGGKQYLVSSGKKLKLEKIDGKEGDKIQFDTLLLFDEKGENIQIGKPTLSSNVEGKIIRHFRGDKVSIVKYKRKVRYRRNRGHRQNYTEVEMGIV